MNQKLMALPNTTLSKNHTNINRINRINTINTINRNRINRNRINRNTVNRINKNSITNLKNSNKKGKRKNTRKLLNPNLQKCLLPEINTVLYRTKYHIKNIINNNCQIDTNKVEIVKRISEGKTGSSSMVDIVKIKNIPCFYYIIKQQTVNKNDYNYFTIEHEKKIYQIVNKLVYNYVTPYCITMLNFHQCNNIYNSNIQYNFMLNETIINWQSNKIYSIREFIKSVNFTELEFLVILIQIVYTLFCFDKINLQHNDLHDNNILIFHNQNFDPSIKKYRYFRYGKDQKEFFLLPETRFNSRIFDFDRGIKNKGYDDPNLYSMSVDGKLLPEFQKEILNDTTYFHENDFYQYITTKNSYADLFKIISYLTNNFVEAETKNNFNPNLLNRNNNIINILTNFCNSPSYSLDILRKYYFINKKNEKINLIDHPNPKHKDSLIKYRFLYYYDQNGKLLNPNKLYRKVFKKPKAYLNYLIKNLDKKTDFNENLDQKNILESYSILNIYQSE